MLSEELGKWFRRFFLGGARPDAEGDFHKEGHWTYSKNMHGNTTDGHAESLSKIGGEQPFMRPQPSEQDIDSTYVCIGAVEAGSDVVSFHCDRNEVGPFILKVNGITMMRSTVVPYRWDKKLDLKGGVVNRPSGPVIFPADKNTKPLMFDINIIKNAFFSGSQEFFDAMTIEAVMVQPQSPVEWPEHVGSPNIGVGAAEGQYSARIRFRTVNGDTTNWGPPSPPITVHKHVAPIYGPIGVSDQYPGAQSAGSQPNPDAQIPTETGIEFRWQVDNYLGMSQMEIAITAFNKGLGLSDPGEEVIVGRFDIQPGEFNDNFRFVYPRDNNVFEIVPADSGANQQAAIEKVNSVEHVDNRVVYGGFVLSDRDVPLEFQSVNGSKVFPITQRVFTKYSGERYDDGYADPVNNTYMKSARRNARYGIGLMLWDTASAKSPVIEVDGNFTMPDRRDRKDGDSLTYSSDPIYAANNEVSGTDNVSPTFDAIVQGTRGKEVDPNTVGFVNVGMLPGVGFTPWTPTGVDANDATRFRFSPVSGVVSGVLNVPPSYQPIAGRIWSPQYHALGVGIYGPSNLRQVAPWCKVITPMRTKPVRVIAQGMGSYFVLGGSGLKARDTMFCDFPEFRSGVVSEAIQSDIQQNPSRYQVILTPFGMYSEVYGYDKFSGFGFPPSVPKTYAVDMLTYAGIQWDAGQVNAGEVAGTMGYQPSASAPSSLSNFVGPAAWRATPDTNSTFHNSQEGGKHRFTIASLSEQEEGRGSVWVLRTTQPIYRQDGTTPNIGLSWSDAINRRYHEPLYVVTIIRNDEQVSVQNVQDYISTGHHIAVERTIGIAPAGGGQFDVELFHARLDDVRAPAGTSGYRFCYVQRPGLPEQRYMCAEGNSDVFNLWPQITAALQNDGFWIAPDGLRVDGVYVIHTQQSDPRDINFIRFGTFPFSPVPPAGSRIVVRYDPASPIKAFGFDATIGPSIYAVWDRYYNGLASSPTGSSQNCFQTTAPLPYFGYRLSPGYNIPRGVSGEVQDDRDVVLIASYRQWCVLWDAELAVPPRLVSSKALSSDVERYAFPRTHYISRPYRISSYTSGMANGLHPAWEQVYPGELPWLNYGGFQFGATYNLDLARQPLVSGKGTPKNGVGFRTNYEAAYIASLEEHPSQIGTAGLRTFLTDNIKPISAENGGINKIMALDQGGFQRLWGWTESGFHWISYNRDILVGADGNVIGSQDIAGFWPRKENWVIRGSKGSPLALWPVSVKANAPVGSQDIDTAVWVDRSSAYQVFGGQVMNIARRPDAQKFLSVILPLLRNSPSGGFVGLSACYNSENAEVWLSLLRDPEPGLDGTQRPPEPVVMVYSLARGEWVGEYSYKYDEIISVGNDIIGFKGLSANYLNKGTTMLSGDNPVPFECYVDVPFAPYGTGESELVAWRVGPDKPDEIRIYDRDKVLMVIANEQLQEAFEPGSGQYWVMEIDNWQQVMNAVEASYDPDRSTPPQGTLFYFRIYHRGDGPFRLNFAELKARPIT